MEPSMDSGRIPVKVLNKLNEHTVGGFVLFYFNATDGAPEHVMTFDSPVHSLAMQKYLTDWSDALRELNIEATRSHIISQNSPPEEPPQ
jgi:hypothetical protein